ncbi:MAG: glycine-rich protein [Bacteroidetes bacterium]|nr:glycine-rich protein [Bacteroidota bacterium]
MKKLTLLVGLSFMQYQIADAQSLTLNYTGGVQTYTVPPCVTSLTVDVQGAQGGLGALGCGGYQGLPGLGGRTQATITVTPGDVINIYVGGAGAPDNNTSAAGGFNGGGIGMMESNYTYYGGGGGGGASDIRLNGNALTDRIVVAGGGGGGGSDGCTCNGLDGGHGGGLVANPGQPGSICICNPSGQGGTQSAGGVKGDWGCNCDAQAGVFGQGGNSNSTSCGGPTGGGGGGGGYYGGGGGGLGAGGGGSNYTVVSATGVVNTAGFKSGDGVVIITPNNGIQAPGAITGNATICANASGSYSISSLLGATSYTWTVPAGSTINSGQGTTAINITAGSTAGNITVSATFPCGTSTPTTFALSINSAPTVVANSTAAAVCAGNSVTLTGSGASTYAWSGGVTNAVAFVPVSTLTYTVTGTGATGCTNTATTTVTVNPIPTVVANSSSAIVCSGSSVTLTGSGATTYSWSGGVTNAVSFVPVSTLTYTVTGTSGAGCTNTATTTVTVNPIPTVVANTTAAAVCLGNSVTLTGGGAISYIWDNSVTDGVSFAPTATTTYMVTGTDASGCVNTATTTITVNALPIVTINSTAALVCLGNSVTLTGVGASVYSWTNSVMDGVSFVPNSTITYTVTGTDANGCSNTATTTVTVNSNPIVNLGQNITQCGGIVILDAGNVGSTYLWSDASNNQTLTVNSTGTYFVNVTDGNGCIGEDTTTITIHVLPTVTGTSASSVVCVDDASVALTGTPIGGVWSGLGVTGSNFSPIGAGVGAQTLIYTFTDLNNCAGTANVNIQVNACTGVTETSLANGVNVFPNPNAGTFTISVNASLGNVKIEMVDMQGRLVYSSLENNVNAGFTKSISLESVSNGIYMLRLTTSSEQQIFKIAVQK